VKVLQPFSKEAKKVVEALSEMVGDNRSDKTFKRFPQSTTREFTNRVWITPEPKDDQ
jgi:hypothetical protein